MSIEVVSLPSETEAFQRLIAQKDAEIARLSAHLKVLQEQLNLLTAKRFGASSEKAHPDQIRLFNEAELEAVAPLEDEEQATIEIPAHRRRAGGRKPLPPQLPRIEIVHCPHDGVVLTAIGEEISEQLDIEPAKVRVLRHVRRKYACPHCNQGVKIASLPPQPIPKSLASPGLAAHIAVGKYQDGLPLYRQEKILQRIGMEISRATLAFWMIHLGRLIQPVMNLLRDQMFAYDVLHMDETTVQVLKEPGKTAAYTQSLVRRIQQHKRRQPRTMLALSRRRPRTSGRTEGFHRQSAAAQCWAAYSCFCMILPGWPRQEHGSMMLQAEVAYHACLSSVNRYSVRTPRA